LESRITEKSNLKLNSKRFHDAARAENQLIIGSDLALKLLYSATPKYLPGWRTGIRTPRAVFPLSWLLRSIFSVCVQNTQNITKRLEYRNENILNKFFMTVINFIKNTTVPERILRVIRFLNLRKLFELLLRPWKADPTSERILTALRKLASKNQSGIRLMERGMPPWPGLTTFFST
jgi:hypothetical protein